MTVRECYEELGSDFDKVLSRLVSEALVKKFALKFLDDPSFGQLERQHWQIKMQRQHFVQHIH